MARRSRMGFVISLFLRGVRFITPLLFGVALFVLKIMLTAVVSIFVGTPEATHRFALEQQEKVIQNQTLPRIYARHYYWLVRVLAVAVVLFGWVCFSFTTVYIVMLIF